MCSHRRSRDALRLAIAALAWMPIGCSWDWQGLSVGHRDAQVADAVSEASVMDVTTRDESADLDGIEDSTGLDARDSVEVTADAVGDDAMPPLCAPPRTTCGADCVDTSGDSRHCGGCDSVCPSRSHATTTCFASACGFNCASGYGDCNGSAADGCEAALTTDANCGGCGARCAARANATAFCMGGACAIACLAGHGDCDHNAANGCEVPFGTNTNCAACGDACVTSSTHVGSLCAALACMPAGCIGGWGDCDANPLNGCETPLDTNLNCGTCGSRCVGSWTCRGGSCGP